MSDLPRTDGVPPGPPWPDGPSMPEPMTTPGREEAIQVAAEAILLEDCAGNRAMAKIRWCDNGEAEDYIEDTRRRVDAYERVLAEQPREEEAERCAAGDCLPECESCEPAEPPQEDWSKFDPMRLAPAEPREEREEPLDLTLTPADRDRISAAVAPFDQARQSATGKRAESEGHKRVYERVYEAIGYRPNAETVAELRAIFAPEPPPAVEEQGDEREAAQAAIRALLKAGRNVRGGFMHWMRGAPTHVLAELLTELEKDGWQLRPIAALTTERHRTQVAEGDLVRLRAYLGAVALQVKWGIDGWKGEPPATVLASWVAERIAFGLALAASQGET